MTTINETTIIRVTDGHGTDIGWIERAGDRWLGYWESVFGRVECCCGHPTIEAAADAVRAYQQKAVA